MKKRFSSLVFAFLLLLSSFALIGCESKVSPIGTTPAPTSLAPRGQIQGVVVEACTLRAIEGADVSVAYDGVVHTVATDKNGQYVFTGVPATDDASAGSGASPTGVYRVTISLLRQNAAIAAASGTPYPDYVYLDQNVAFTDLNDGDATSTGTESGSGADTPITGISKSSRIEIGKLDGTITGSVTEEGGLAVNAAKVTLVFDSAAGNRTASIPTNVSTTTDNQGKYTFTSLPSAGDVFDIYIEKSGYDQFTVQNVAPICNTVVTLAGNTQINKTAAAADNQKPYIISASFPYLADVSKTTTQIKFVYNESLANVFTDLQGGTTVVIEGFKFKPGQVFSKISLATTNVTNDTVVVEPTSLVGGYKYAVDLSKIEDLSGNLMDATLSKYTDGSSIYRFTVAAGTGQLAAITDFKQTELNPATDAARGNEVITYGNSNLPKQDSDYDGTKIDLNWGAITNAMAYRVYGSWCGGPFQMVYDGARSSCPACTFVSTSTGSFDGSNSANNPRMVEDVTHNTGGGSSAADSANAGTMDDLSQRLKFYVVSVNGDGIESNPSNTVTVMDNVKPMIVSMVTDTLDDTSTSGAGTITLTFSEPMDYASVKNKNNYSWVNGANIAGTLTSDETPAITSVSVFKSGNLENAQVVLTLDSVLQLDKFDAIKTTAIDMDGNVSYPTDTTSSTRSAGQDYLNDIIAPRISSVQFSGSAANGYFDVSPGTAPIGTPPVATNVNDKVTIYYSEELKWSTTYDDGKVHAVTAGYGLSIDTDGAALANTAVAADYFSVSGSSITYYFVGTNLPIIPTNVTADVNTQVTPGLEVNLPDMSGNTINPAYNAFQFNRGTGSASVWVESNSNLTP